MRHAVFKVHQFLQITTQQNSPLELSQICQVLQVAGPELTEAQRTSQVRQSVTRRIQTLGRQKKPKEAVSQLAEMARLGVQPDTQAATALIDACVRNKKMEMAQKVFEELFGDDSSFWTCNTSGHANHILASMLQASDACVIQSGCFVQTSKSIKTKHVLCWCRRIFAA